MTAGLRALGWIGARARWMLAIGAFAALLMQDLAALLRPALPFFVAMLFALAMIRIDLPALLRQALRPRRLLAALAFTLAMTVATPALLHALAQLAGLPDDARAALVYAHAAPPIASSAGLAFLMGLNAAFALEVSIVASLLAPLIGPLVVLGLLGADVSLGAGAILSRLALVIGGGALAAILLRRLVGAEVIGRHATAFDGLGAIGMLVFIVPIFDGITARLLAEPLLALGVLLLAAACNFGLQWLAARATRSLRDDATAGAAGVMWGNRNVSLYLAVLPENAFFSLYTALYQFPMYLTPLVMRGPLAPRRFTGS